jgi:hypothetical protein
MKNLYRYEIEYRNEDDDTQVRLIELPVFRETEYTYFVGHPYQTSEIFGGKLKRVKKDAMNTYAYDTKEKAKDHFIRRTNTRIKWFEFWIEECKKGLELIEKI